MSLLINNYATIPNSVLLSKDVDIIFDYYIGEFFDKNESVNTFVAMFLNIIRDFLEHKIDERILGSLIHKSLVDDRTKKYNYEPYLWAINDVLALLHELMDILWTKDSDDYSNYLMSVKIRLADLDKKYSGTSYEPK